MPPLISLLLSELLTYSPSFHQLWIIVLVFLSSLIVEWSSVLFPLIGKLLPSWSFLPVSAESLLKVPTFYVPNTVMTFCTSHILLLCGPLCFSVAVTSHTWQFPDGINLSQPAFRLFSWTPPAPSPSSPFSGGPATSIHAQLYLLCYALFYWDCCFPIPISYITLKFYSSFNSQYHFLQKPNLLSFHSEFINGPFLYTFRYCILL